MNRTMTLLVLAMATVPSLANADALCGKLTSYCGNGWCNQNVTPTYCLNGRDTCRDGAPVKIVSENHLAMDELNRLLDQGEGTRVCVTGSKDDSGVFHVSSASEES